MSRSHKKNPWYTDHHVKSSQENKKFANKKVRNTEEIPNGGSYKKVSESWDICDFKFFYTKEEAIEEYNKAKENDEEWVKKYTLKEWLRHWRTIYYNK